MLPLVIKSPSLHLSTLLGHRLNTTVLKKIRAWHDIDCVVRCVDDTCCRSVNFLRTLDLDEEENKENCEMLHDAVVSWNNYNLIQADDNYDYFILHKPARVSI